MKKAIPQFLHDPPWAFFLFFSVCVSLSYFLLGLAAPLSFTTVAQIGLFLVPSIWFILRFEPSHIFDKDHLIRNFALVFVVSLGLSYLLNETLPHWLEIFPMPKELEEMYEKLLHQNKDYGFFIDVLMLALVPAICEELFFRGVIQMTLMRKIGAWPAVIVTSLFFSAYHFNPWYLPFYFVLGIWFGSVFISTRHLGFSILAHFVNNTLGLVLYYYF